MIRKTEPSEHQIQCAIVEWANNIFIDHPNGGKVRLGSYLIKITNEGKRSWAQGKKMKAEGLKKGVSDLFFAFPFTRTINSGCACCPDYEERSGLWIELKAKGKKPNKEQLEFLSAMRDVGYDAVFKDTVNDGIQAIKDYLGVK